MPQASPPTDEPDVSDVLAAARDAAIACWGLTKRYGRRTAVDSLSLCVPRGTTFGLLGPNGAGKTTTILMVLGLVRPSEGHASVLGGSIRDGNIRRRLGFVPEKFQLPRYLTAREYLEIHCDLAHIAHADRARRVSECLELVELADRGDDRLKGFSKGMQQRTMLAQALLTEPELLVLDEPTSALDPLGRRMVRGVIDAAAQRGATVVLNSHLLSEVEAACDQVAIMREGRVVGSGSVDDLRAPTLHVTLVVGDFGQRMHDELARVLDGQHATVPAADGVVEVTGTVASREDLPRLADAVSVAGGRLYQLTHNVESLEDVFMRLVDDTGRSGGSRRVGETGS